MNKYKLIMLLVCITLHSFAAVQKKNILFDFTNIPERSLIEIKPAKDSTTLTANPGYQRSFELERDTNLLGKNPQYIKDLWITPPGKSTIKASSTKDLVESTNRFIEALDNPVFIVKESGVGLSISLSSATPLSPSKPVEPAKPIASGSKPSDIRSNVTFDFTKVASNPKVEFMVSIKVYNPVNPTPINISTVGSYGVNHFGLNDIKKHTFGNPEYVKEIKVGTQFKSGNMSMGKSFKASSVKGLINTINKLIYQTPQNLVLAFELDANDQLKLISDKENSSSGTTKPSVPAARPIGGPKPTSSSTPASTTTSKKFGFENMYGESITLDITFSDGKKETKTLKNKSGQEYVLSAGKSIKSITIKPNSLPGSLDIDKFYDQDANYLIPIINENIQSGQAPVFVIEVSDFYPKEHISTSDSANSSKNFSFENMYGESLILDIVFSDDKKETKTLQTKAKQEYVLPAGKLIKNILIKRASDPSLLDIDKFYDQEAGYLVKLINDDILSGEEPIFVIANEEFTTEYST